MDRLTLTLLILAALLHDIGKAAQRAERPKSKDLQTTYCPSDYKTGHPKMTHVLYTDYFIENDLKLPPELEGYRARLARLASAHHHPDTNLMELAISTGDKLSAGTDRTPEQPEDAEDYKRARLLSAFSFIDLYGGQTDSTLEENAYYSLSSLNNNPFPSSLQKAQQSTYAELFESFLEDLDHLPLNMGVEHYTDSLQSLLEKYIWCVPSSTYKTIPDISLFDHAYTTAAIAQCLAVYHSENGDLPGSNNQQEKKFLLCGGDLSGIQSFIFGIEKSHSAGVAKILRARSLLLQAVTRSVVISLLEALNLMPQAKIMDAGGQFILLLPNTERVRSYLPEFEASVQNWFLEYFQGEVTLPLSYDIELTEEDLNMHRFQDKFNEFNNSLQKSKLQRFSSLMDSQFSPVFSMDYSAYQDGTCQICNIHPVDSKASDKFLAEYQKEVNLCSKCFDQIWILGKKLPRKNYLLFSRKGSEEGMELFDGIYMSLIEEVNKDQKDALEIVNYRDFGQYSHYAFAGHLPEFTQEDISELFNQGEVEKNDLGQYVWKKEEEIVEERQPKTLHILAHLARIQDNNGGSPRGKSLLGAFKADVDNLGLVFGAGLQNRLSISRFSFLSRMLNHFFSDYLIECIKKDYPNIYVVFAGGDDLFFLGPWSDIVDIAGYISERFREYTAFNPQVTLSAGITVHKPREPVHTIARRAESQLEISKDRKVENTVVKNGITLFGVTVDWQRFQELLEKGRWIEQLIMDSKITKGLVGRMMYYADQHNKLMKGNIEAGIYLAHMEYDFKRNVYGSLNKDNLQEGDAIAAGLKNVENMDQLRLPISWALYRIRTD